MLRPKQLLPLIKASQRSWILAGTSAGSRTGDGTCNPHGVATADEKDENFKRTPHLPHPGHEVSVVTAIDWDLTLLLCFSTVLWVHLLSFSRFIFLVFFI